MPARRVPLLLAAALLAAALPTPACGGSEADDPRPPQVGVAGEEEDAATDLGFPAFATKNTTRVGGADSVATAAAVARAVYPGVDADTRPKAVALVDADDWQSGVAAAVLAADPIGAPMLLSEGGDLPAATRDALEGLSPTGSPEAGDAQVIRVGDAAEAEGYTTTDVTGAGPAELAAQLDALVATAREQVAERVLVVSSEARDIALPAAGWAAKSGDAVLFTERDALPDATREALERRRQPRIYVLGGEQVVSARVERQLRRLGTVRRIDGGADPVESAIEFARYTDGTFGWGVVDPGHGLVFVDLRRPLDAAVAAPLSTTGKYGPILLHTGGDRLDAPLEDYLLDIRPGYRQDPVRGVYNHGWIVGDEAAMPVAVQARIDTLLEITQVDIDTEEPSS